MDLLAKELARDSSMVNRLMNRTVLQNSNLRGSRVMSWSSDLEGKFGDDLGAIRFSHEQCFAEAAFHLLNLLDRGDAPGAGSH